MPGEAPAPALNAPVKLRTAKFNSQQCRSFLGLVELSSSTANTSSAPFAAAELGGRKAVPLLSRGCRMGLVAACKARKNPAAGLEAPELL